MAATAIVSSNLAGCLVQASLLSFQAATTTIAHLSIAYLIISL